MALRLGHIAGVPTRLWRVSFTGELGFEINVPSDRGRDVWEAVHAAGQSFGITPYGTEAMHVLRAEKGYVIVGQETDGTVTPVDAGLGWAIGKTKPDFVGKRSLERPAMLRADRKQLVGLEVAGRTVPEEGAQIVDPAAPDRVIGHVSSAYWSATLKRPIALALVRGGRDRMGQRLTIAGAGDGLQARICDSVFVDRDGKRLNG